MVSAVLLAQEPEAIISRKQTAEPVNAGQKVTVQNLYGDVRARRATGKTLEVFAVIQNLDPDSPAPDIQTQRGENALKIRVVSPEAPREGADRADLVVYVPDGVPIAVETAHGAIEFKGLHADVSAGTESGAIRIQSIAGHVQATAGDGSIEVDLIPGATALPQAFTTRTGDITLYLRAGMAASIRAETSGEISTDYTLQVIYDGTKEPSKKAVATIGEGGGMIEARSKRGRIRLLRGLEPLPAAN